ARPVTCRAARAATRSAGDGDAAHRALQLRLGDRHHLRRDARGVREGQHRRLVPDEQHGAGPLLPAVAGRAARSAVVRAGRTLAGEDPVGLLVTDLGSYLITHVEHGRHGSLLGSAVLRSRMRSEGFGTPSVSRRTVTTDGPLGESRLRLTGCGPPGWEVSRGG